MRKPRECKPGCRCIVCDTTRPAKTHAKICVTIPQATWEAFGDECLLLGREKSPTIARLMEAWLRQRKEKEKRS